MTNGEATVSASDATLVASAQAKSVALFALSTNSGTVYVGGTGVTTANGFPLAAGAAMTIDVGDTNAVHIIGTASDKVRWLAYTI